jgi:hypothetical protein
MKKIILLLTCVLMLTIAGVAGASSVLDFEDLYTGPGTSGVIPTSYHGFTMGGYAYWITSGVYPGSGYQNGTTGNVSMYTAWAQPITMGGAAFNFFGADITSAWNIGEDAYVQGWLGGVKVYEDHLFDLSYTGPLNYVTNFTNIDTLVFLPGSMGTNAGLGGSGQHLDIDNLRYSTSAVPLPPSALLLGSGLLGLVGFGWRRRKEK